MRLSISPAAASASRSRYTPALSGTGAVACACTITGAPTIAIQRNTAARRRTVNALSSFAGDCPPSDHEIVGAEKGQCRRQRVIDEIVRAGEQRAIPHEVWKQRELIARQCIVAPQLDDFESRLRPERANLARCVLPVVKMLAQPERA